MFNKLLRISSTFCVLATVSAALSASLSWSANASTSPATKSDFSTDKIAIKNSHYPGTMQLDVDLSQAARKIFFVKQTIPVKAGHLHLAYPKWIRGEHAPTGTLESVTGLKLFANGKRLAWQRDAEDMFVLHLDVPANTSEIQLEFQFLTPISNGEYGSIVTTTPRYTMLEWNQVLFYPMEYRNDLIRVLATLSLPGHWQMASALENLIPLADSQTGEDKATVRFKEVSLSELLDSPVVAGKHLRRVVLNEASGRPVTLNMVAERADNLSISEPQIAQHQNLIRQAQAMFGVEHYARYEFLQVLSDHAIPDGLEHHQSSNNRSQADFYTSPELYLSYPTLLPHEFIHTWNGKFRRPVGLAGVNHHVPMKGDLLWVYEGLTNYLAGVLSTRSGMWNAEQYRDFLAYTAAEMDARPGRSWLSLREVVTQAQVAYRLPNAWGNYRRTTDFYPEGGLLWLAVDTKIRELTKGSKTLDDFSRIFFAADAKFPASSHTVKPYQVEEVFNTLNRVVAFDWATYINQILDTNEAKAPLDGLIMGGWELTYSDTPTEYFKAKQKDSKLSIYLFSLGLNMVRDKADGRDVGTIDDVLWDGPAFKAGLTPGQKIISVNGEAIDSDNLGAAIAQAKIDHQPIELIVSNQDYLSTVKIPYFEGLRYPRLQRVEGRADYLGAISLAIRRVEK